MGRTEKNIIDFVHSYVYVNVFLFPTGKIQTSDIRLPLVVLYCAFKLSIALASSKYPISG